MPEMILIVEDDAIISMRLEDLLESWGYQVTSAPSGEEAIASAHARRPDLVLMDIHLDGHMDGVQAAQQLKTEMQLPTIFLTAYADDDLMERAQLAEPYGYLIKPVSERELKSTLRMALYKRQVETKMRADERRNRALIEKSYEVVLLLDGGMTIHFASPSSASVLGYAPDEVLQHDVSEYMHVADLETFEKVFIDLLANPGGSQSQQTRVRHKAGHWCWVEINVTNLLHDPDVGMMVANIQDITARKQAEMLSQKQVDRLTALRVIDNAIISNVDLRVMLQILLEQVIAQLQADAACILEFNEPLRELRALELRGFKTDAFRNSRLRLEESVAYKVVYERRLRSIEDLPHNPSKNMAFDQAVRREGFISYHAVPLLVKGVVKGVLEVFHRTRFKTDNDWEELVQALANQAALAIDHSTMFRDLQRGHHELVVAYDETIEGWARALDLRDEETEDHSRRVTHQTEILARAVGMSQVEVTHVRRGALLHDIGKMGVADSILRKPGTLTPEEWDEMRQHPTKAYHLLQPINYLRPAIDIPYCHHEKWNGTGYPRGLKGTEIPLAARVFAVIDVWDALTHDRPYRPAWPRQKAIDLLISESGKHFDPAVLNVFFRLLDAGEIE